MKATRGEQKSTGELETRIKVILKNKTNKQTNKKKQRKNKK